MTVTRDVAPGVHRIADAFVNLYLVEDHTGVPVVDAGLPSSWARSPGVPSSCRRRATPTGTSSSTSPTAAR